MVENKKSDVEVGKNQPVASRKKHGLFPWAVLLVVVAAGYGLWQKPEVISQAKSFVAAFRDASNAVSNEQLKTEIEALNRRLTVAESENQLLKNRLESFNATDLTTFNERFSALEKNNLNIIDSKADVATVLGLVTRVDKAETRLDNMAKITDKGALILTAAMLVKEAADEGASFTYEAEVLKQIAEGDQRVKAPVEEIAALAEEGIVSKKYLQSRFSGIYDALLAEQEKTWKDRLNSQLGKIIKVKKTKAPDKEFEADKGLEKVKSLVAAGDLAKAAQELALPENKKFMEDKALADWYRQLQNKLAFDQAVRRISTSSLVMMKVNFIKRETKND